MCCKIQLMNLNCVSHNAPCLFYSCFYCKFTAIPYSIYSDVLSV